MNKESKLLETWKALNNIDHKNRQLISNNRPSFRNAFSYHRDPRFMAKSLRMDVNPEVTIEEVLPQFESADELIQAEKGDSSTGDLIKNSNVSAKLIKIDLMKGTSEIVQNGQKPYSPKSAESSSSRSLSKLTLTSNQRNTLYTSQTINTEEADKPIPPAKVLEYSLRPSPFLPSAIQVLCNRIAPGRQSMANDVNREMKKSKKVIFSDQKHAKNQSLNRDKDKDGQEVPAVNPPKVMQFSKLTEATTELIRREVSDMKDDPICEYLKTLDKEILSIDHKVRQMMDQGEKKLESRRSRPSESLKKLSNSEVLQSKKRIAINATNIGQLFKKVPTVVKPEDRKVTNEIKDWSSYRADVSSARNKSKTSVRSTQSPQRNIQLSKEQSLPVRQVSLDKNSRKNRQRPSQSPPINQKAKENASSTKLQPKSSKLNDSSTQNPNSSNFFHNPMDKRHNLHSITRKIVERRARGAINSDALAGGNRLYTQGMASYLLRAESAKRVQVERETKEMSECTFRPNTSTCREKSNTINTSTE